MQIWANGQITICWDFRQKSIEKISLVALPCELETESSSLPASCLHLLFSFPKSLYCPFKVTKVSKCTMELCKPGLQHSAAFFNNAENRTCGCSSPTLHIPKVLQPRRPNYIEIPVSFFWSWVTRTKALGVSDPPQVTEWLPREDSANLPALISPCSKINSFVKTSFGESWAMLKTIVLFMIISYL